MCAARPQLCRSYRSTSATPRYSFVSYGGPLVAADLLRIICGGGSGVADEHLEHCGQNGNVADKLRMSNCNLTDKLRRSNGAYGS
jgi:hypothetical protein